MADLEILDRVEMLTMDEPVRVQHLPDMAAEEAAFGLHGDRVEESAWRPVQVVTMQDRDLPRGIKETDALLAQVDHGELNTVDG